MKLRETLNYEPVPLRFGTSGRRGLIADLTQLEVCINALAELEYLQSLPRSGGGVGRGEEFFYACDLRPSSSAFVPGAPVRGQLAQAIAQAIADAGMKPVFLGFIPTPALANYALSRNRGSMMVTGSHIPFDRNGYKTNSALGELLKRDEAPIQARVDQVRARLYGQPMEASQFNSNGMFRDGSRPLPPSIPQASAEYLRRYADYFAGQNLRGMPLLVYQHSAVGRDLLVDLLRRFEAEVIPAGRSETFVPIDTEAIDAGQLRAFESLAAAAWKEHGPIDALVSTDGDSDRPLILGVEAVNNAALPCRVRFFGGDLVGMIVAEYLRADAVVVPISCNDAVDMGPLKNIARTKTRIGSPYVIAGMQDAIAKGYKVVCGWEANGGFLLGSTLAREGRTLRALPTRDAFLPILAVLLRAKQEGTTVSALFDRLPPRFSRAALLKNFPQAAGRGLVARYSLADAGVREVSFLGERVTLWNETGAEMKPAKDAVAGLARIREELERCFTPGLGFGRITRLNYTDGVRIHFANGDVAHVRPSGNADELRIYAVADTQARADAIARNSVDEPAGILRRLEAQAGAAQGGPKL
jgi:phosphomannomutase